MIEIGALYKVKRPLGDRTDSYIVYNKSYMKGAPKIAGYIKYNSTIIILEYEKLEIAASIKVLYKDLIGWIDCLEGDYEKIN